MASFGENLRQARKAHKITLQEIAASTKIGTRALQALEDDRFDLLPGGIFNKGFVRAYARCVGLDEEKTVAAYMTAASVAAPETDMQALSSQVSEARQLSREPWLSAGAVASVLALIVALGVGGMWLKEQRKEAKEAAQRPVENPVVAATAPVTIPPQTTSASSDANPAPGAAQETTTGGAINANQNTNQNPAPAANQSANLGSGVQGSKEPTAPVEISIAATGRAWISVSSDGKKVEQLVLDPDKPEMRSRSYKAQEKLLLIAGNPSALSVTYNGKPVGTLGKAGQRATITFTPQGIDKE